MNGQYSLILYTEANNRGFQLILPVGTPYKEAHAACLIFAENIIEMEKEALKSEEEKKATEENTASN